MKDENIQSLERLSLYCHICGLISILLGISITFMDIINEDFKHIQVGLFILVIGYAFVKISARITSIMNVEKKESQSTSYF